MAKFKNNHRLSQNNESNNKENNQTASTEKEGVVFVETKATIANSQAEEKPEVKDIMAEIENIMTEGSYRDKLEALVPIEGDDGVDAEVFKNNNQPNKKNTKLKNKKEKKTKKTYEKTTFAHKMKVVGVLFVLGIFTGSGLGVWYFNSIRSTYNPNAIDLTDIIQTVEETFKKNNINATKKEGLAWVEKAQNMGLTPMQLSPVDNFLLAEYNVSLADTYVIDGKGSVYSTGVTQDIISRKKYNGQYYTFESISPSKIAFIGDIVLCDKYDGKKTITIYESQNTSPKAEDWKYLKEISSADYEFESGTMPNMVQPYIISEKTVTSTNDNTVIEDNGDGTYSFTMILDNQNSVAKYAKQVRRTGGLGSYPEFSYIAFTATIDSDWNLLNFGIKEKYKAVKGIKASCEGTLNYTVRINGQVEMPV